MGVGSMKAYLIMTAIGPDRPGLVDEVSEFLAERDLNIESSRMAVLGGEFAMILLASGDSDGIEAVSGDRGVLAEKTGLQIHIRPTQPPERREAPASMPFSLSASGMDHQGLVHEISKVMHDFSVNIESMDTWVEAAPVSGTPIFSMEALVSVPASVRIRRLKRALEELGDELNMDIEFEHQG